MISISLVYSVFITLLLMANYNSSKPLDNALNTLIFVTKFILNNKNNLFPPLKNYEINHL